MWIFFSLHRHQRYNVWNGHDPALFVHQHGSLFPHESSCPDHSGFTIWAGHTRPQKGLTVTRTGWSKKSLIRPPPLPPLVTSRQNCIYVLLRMRRARCGWRKNRWTKWLFKPRFPHLSESCCWCCLSYEFVCQGMSVPLGSFPILAGYWVTRSAARYGKNDILLFIQYIMWPA